MPDAPRLLTDDEALGAMRVAGALTDVVTRAMQADQGAPGLSPAPRAMLRLLTHNGAGFHSVVTLVSSCESTNALDAIASPSAVILLSMHDALVQALYIGRDPALADARGALYLDFEHVERYRLPLDARRGSSDDSIRERYEAVRARYPKGASGRKSKSAKTRDRWHEGTLLQLARAVDLEREHSRLRALLAGAANASPHAAYAGPPIQGAEAVRLAESIVRRAAGALVTQAKLPVSDETQSVLQ